MEFGESHLGFTRTLYGYLDLILRNIQNRILKVEHKFLSPIFAAKAQGPQGCSR